MECEAFGWDARNQTTSSGRTSGPRDLIVNNKRRLPMGAALIAGLLDQGSSFDSSLHIARLKTRLLGFEVEVIVVVVPQLTVIHAVAQHQTEQSAHFAQFRVARHRL